MKKLIFILSLAILPIIISAQSEKLPDSLLIYSFNSNTDSSLSVVDARTYNTEGLLETRRRKVNKNSVIIRRQGEYNATYSYTDNGTEKTTTIIYLNTNGDTTEREIYTYQDNDMVYVQQLRVYSPDEGIYKLIDARKRIYKGIRDYEYTNLLEHATGLKMSAFDESELPLFHADTIILNIIAIPGTDIWDTMGVYTFNYNVDSTIERVVFRSSYRIENERNDYVFFYNGDKQCMKIERFEYFKDTSDSIISVQNFEITQELNENDQPLVVRYVYIDNEYMFSTFGYKKVFTYDDAGNILSEVFYDSPDTTSIFWKYYYIYKSSSNIAEYDASPISVFPNPAQSHFTVTNTENANLTLYNILGQKVRQVIGEGESTIIQTEGLPQGIYLLKVEKEGAVLTRKIQISN